MVYVINDNGTHFPTVLQVGCCDDHAVLGEQLGGLHIRDLAAHQHVKGGVDQQLVIPDVQAARATDDLVHIIDALGHALPTDGRLGFSGDHPWHCLQAESQALGIGRLILR